MFRYITATQNLPKFIWFGFLLSYCAYTAHWPTPFFLREYTVPIYFVILGYSFLLLHFRALPVVALIVMMLFLHVISLGLPGFDLVSFFRYAALSTIFLVMGFCRTGAIEIEQVLRFLVPFTCFILVLYFLKPEMVSFYDYGEWRIKAWFSEPSGAAILSGLLVWSGVYTKNNLRLILGLTICLFSFSIINVLICSTIILLEARVTFKNLFVFIVIMFAIILSWELFAHTGDRIIYLYSVLSEFNFVDFLLYTNKRTAVIYHTYVLMDFNGYLWFGYGLNQEAFGSGENLTATLGLAHLFLKSFGILGVLVYFLLTTIMVLKYRKTSYGWLLVFVIYATINSAHGLLLQSFWFYGLGLLIYSNLKSLTIKK